MITAATNNPMMDLAVSYAGVAVLVGLAALVVLWGLARWARG